MKPKIEVKQDRERQILYWTLRHPVADLTVKSTIDEPINDSVRALHVAAGCKYSWCFG
jgi:hypothetical protein